MNKVLYNWLCNYTSQPHWGNLQGEPTWTGANTDAGYGLKGFGGKILGCVGTMLKKKKITEHPVI